MSDKLINERIDYFLNEWGGSGHDIMAQVSQMTMLRMVNARAELTAKIKNLQRKLLACQQSGTPDMCKKIQEEIRKAKWDLAVDREHNPLHNT